MSKTLVYHPKKQTGIHASKYDTIFGKEAGGIHKSSGVY